jgi:uncharacterized membrane protein YkvI
VSVWRVYFVPAGVLQSLMVGGGYGTGREIVEYFSRFGFIGGLFGLALVAACLAVLLAVSYEFARVYRAYDYRRFSRELLGRYWIAFEIVYLLMSALVVAVVAAASGSLVDQYLHIPALFGIACLLILVMVFAFYGRRLVTGVLAYKALILCAVLLVYFLAVVPSAQHALAAQFSRHQIVPGWGAAAVQYLLYSSVVIPTMLFATSALTTRRQAVLAALISALAAMLPATLLHISFGAAYPSVLAQAMPLYWMISALHLPALTIAYLVVLFGSLFDVGLGFIQSVNERIDGWSVERGKGPISPSARAGIALACLLVSGALSVIGIVPLIAKGYGAMAYGFLVLFVGPLLTVGLWKLSRARPHLAVAAG